MNDHVRERQLGRDGEVVDALGDGCEKDVRVGHCLVVGDELRDPAAEQVQLEQSDDVVVADRRQVDQLCGLLPVGLFFHPDTTCTTASLSGSIFQPWDWMNAMPLSNWSLREQLSSPGAWDSRTSRQARSGRG
jgi:hypothetical protein